MKMYLLPVLLLFACSHNSTHQSESVQKPGGDERELVELQQMINEAGTTIEERFSPPAGHERVPAEKGSFPTFLRNLPLKPHGAQVRYFDGRLKQQGDVYDAVVDLPIGKRDLHQCADAVMRLRADYLWREGRYEEIHFNFTNGFQVDYAKWMRGNRIRVDGNRVTWQQVAAPSNTQESYWKYMENIFAYAGTASLSKEMGKVDLSNIEIGDVFIQGGFPGHAIIVVDMVVNPDTQQRMMLLAQSYMPAQEIQVLKNPRSKGSDPWYSTSITDNLLTPEWTFSPDDLKRFR
jgi:hypothetical protein